MARFFLAHGVVSIVDYWNVKRLIVPLVTSIKED